MCSTVWSPFLHWYCGLSIILHLHKYDFMLPCPVVIVVNLGVVFILIFNLSSTLGKKSFVVASFVVCSHSLCHCFILFSFSSFSIALFGICILIWIYRTQINYITLHYITPEWKVHCLPLSQHHISVQENGLQRHVLPATHSDRIFCYGENPSIKYSHKVSTCMWRWLHGH